MVSEKKRQQVAETLINEMFRIAGHDVSFEDIKGRQDDWYAQWTMTMEQYEQWKDWGTKYLRKEMRMRKESARKEMAWFSVMYGLKFADYELK